MRVALALAVAALLAASCGSGAPATSAAEVAPSSTYLLIQGRTTPKLERALAFLPESRELERLLARAVRLTGAGERPTLALLDRSGSRAVALAQPSDRGQLDKDLDAAGIAHARFRGWTVFSRSRESVAAVRRAKQRLGDAAWFHPPSGDVAFVRRSGTVTATRDGEHASATRTEPPVGEDTEHPLADSIPIDAVAAAAVHDGATVFAGLPFASQLKEGLGLHAGTLATAAPADAVLYARPGVPVATVTLLAAGKDVGRARRVVQELAPNAKGIPGTIRGIAATHVPLGPVDLFYGRVGRTIFVTDDAAASLAARDEPLEPEGLPAETRGWAYVDVPTGLPALEGLARLAGTRLSPVFVRKAAGLESVLAYRTRGALTIRIR